MSKTPITVVILAKNEEDHLEEGLKSVHGWADEILVIDDESTDHTVEIARRYARVITRKMENEGRHRNWSYAQARNEWVLSLDADESVSEELKQEIDEHLADNEKWEAFSIPIKTYIGDYWVQHSGWYPANKVRMFMKTKQRYEEAEVHPRVMCNIETKKLSKDIIHRGYPDIAHFLASLNRQTTLEAVKWIRTGRKMTRGKAFWRAFDRFPRIYFRKKGYKDGFIGFIVAFFASLYQVMSYAKYWELKRSQLSTAQPHK
ncbi:MAG: glycosyltransferase family 2 protein [Candidatus Omnitrophica bacterium]|nr:glycosyltransferase family 2 protein [Candidatus Omnitrophota bacterium]